VPSTTASHSIPLPDSLGAKLVSAQQALLLERDVSDAKILLTIKHMKKNKSPGPDGFNVNFFIHAWDIVGEVFTAAIRSFFSQGCLLRGTNATAITLVPKVRNPSSMNDYRPISYLSGPGLSYIASGIGKPLFVDKITEKLEPMNFARICVEISSTSGWPSSLEVVVLNEETKSEKVALVEVEYQNKPMSCSHCKSCGHSLLKCPHANYKWVPKVSHSTTNSIPPLAADVPSSSSATPSPSLNDAPESWTLVAKEPKQHTDSTLVVLPDSNKFNLLSAVVADWKVFPTLILLLLLTPLWAN